MSEIKQKNHYFKNIVSSINETQSIDHIIHEQEERYNIFINHKHYNHCYDLIKQFLLNPFFITAKSDFKSDDLMHDQNLHPGIGTHLQTKLVHEVLLYTWKHQHAIKLK